MMTYIAPDHNIGFEVNTVLYLNHNYGGGKGFGFS